MRVGFSGVCSHITPPHFTVRLEASSPSIFSNSFFPLCRWWLLVWSSARPSLWWFSTSSSCLVLSTGRSPLYPQSLCRSLCPGPTTGGATEHPSGPPTCCDGDGPLFTSQCVRGWRRHVHCEDCGSTAVNWEYLWSPQRLVLHIIWWGNHSEGHRLTREQYLLQHPTSDYITFLAGATINAVVIKSVLL